MRLPIPTWMTAAKCELVPAMTQNCSLRHQASKETPLQRSSKTDEAMNPTITAVNQQTAYRSSCKWMFPDQSCGFLLQTCLTSVYTWTIECDAERLAQVRQFSNGLLVERYTEGTKKRSVRRARGGRRQYVKIARLVKG